MTKAFHNSSSVLKSWRYQPGQTIGGYRLVRPLGRGGAGEVFEAKQERIGQRVALKVLSTATQAPQERARFLNEARILARLHHPNIVTIFACDETSTGDVYIAIEYLEGSSLRGHLRNLVRPMPLQRALAIALQIAEAMAYAHQHGVTHRDLKPENIMLFTELYAEDSYRIKIVDFGIAKAPPFATEPDTQMDTPRAALLGTPQYMAPEQCLGTEDVSGKIDVYALAVVLFEMLTGRPPFLSSSSVQLLTLHRSEPPPALQDHAPLAPSSLCQLVERMFHKVPAERPTMSEVAHQLRVLASPALTRHRETTPRSILARRGMVLGLSLLPFLIWGGTSWRREQARSEERLNSFLDTAEEIISSTDWKLAQRAGTASIRLDTLRQLGDKLDQLRKPERPNWRIERLAIRCQYRLGDLAMVYETLGNARRAYQTGSSMTVTLQGWAPDQEEAKQLLATDLTKQGDVARQEGRQDVAKQRYAEACLIQEGLLLRHPGNPEYLRQLAISYDGRGDVLLEEGDEQSARALYDKALGTLRQRATRAADMWYQQYLEALVIYRFGEVARLRKDETSSEEEYTRALVLVRSIVTAQPQPTLYRLLLGQLNERMGQLCIKTGRLAEAHPFSAQALVLAHALTDGDPDNRRSGLLLVQSLALASDLAEADEQLAAARTAEEEAQRHRRRFAEDMDNLMWQRELLVGHMNLFRLTEDITIAQHHLDQAKSILHSFKQEDRWGKDRQVMAAWQKVREISHEKASF